MNLLNRLIKEPESHVVVRLFLGFFLFGFSLGSSSSGSSHGSGGSSKSGRISKHFLDLECETFSTRRARVQEEEHSHEKIRVMNFEHHGASQFWIL